MKLRPHRQESVAGHMINKLSKRYYEPFNLIKVISEVEFELELLMTLYHCVIFANIFDQISELSSKKKELK